MTSANEYRKLAAELKSRAGKETNPDLARDWTDLARCYLRLAAQADQNSLADIWIEVGPKPSLDVK